MKKGNGAWMKMRSVWRWMFAVTGGCTAVVLLLAAFSGTSEAEGVATASMPGSRTSAILLVVGLASGAGFCVLKKRYLEFKPWIDKLAAAFGLVLSLPILAMAAIAVKRDSGGSVLFSQRRIGINRRNGDRRRRQCYVEVDRRLNGTRRRRDYGGRIFTLYKLRTMREDAEKETGPVWATSDDPRITPVGTLLRKTHVDEVPQLMNVLKGEMSLIGPRPERPFFVEQFKECIDGYEDRLSVRPGLTGLGQLWIGYDENLDTVRQKLEVDRLYIQQRSLWLDTKILLWTFVRLIWPGYSFTNTFNGNGKEVLVGSEERLLTED